MNNYNKVILIGRLTQNPLLRHTASGMAYANFGLAINHQYKNRKGVQCNETTFIDVIAWDKLAEQASRHLSKGAQVHLDGRLQFKTWEDTNGRGKRSKHSIVAESIQFLGPRDPVIPDPTAEKKLVGPPPVSPLAEREAHTEVSRSVIDTPQPSSPCHPANPDSASEYDFDIEEGQAVEEDPMDEELTEKEIDLLEEINEPYWQENVRELCLLKRSRMRADIDDDDRSNIDRQMEDIIDELEDIRAIYKNASKILSKEDHDEDEDSDED